MSNTQLVRASDLGLPNEPQTDITAIQDAMLTATDKGYNVLAPTMRLQFMPPNHQISMRIVQFDAQFNGGEKSNGSYYQVDGGKLALHGSSLAMLAAAAGISTTSTHTELLEPYVWRSVVRMTMKGFDGQRRYVEKTKIVDLREGSPDCPNWSAQRLAGARQHGAALAESKAANRVVRYMLGLKAGYTRKQAAQPFVFPVLVWIPNLDDPEVNKMVTAAELGLIDQVYGGGGDAVAGAALADASNIVDANAEPPALTDRSDLDAMEAGQAPREKQRVSAHPDDDANTAQRQVEAPPPIGDTCVHDQGDRLCGVEVPDHVADYSRRNFSKVLCRSHQPRS